MSDTPKLTDAVEGNSRSTSSWAFPIGSLVASLKFDGRPTPEDMAALSEYVALIAKQMGRGTKPKDMGCISHPGGSRQYGECLPCKLGWPAEDGIIDDQSHGESLLNAPMEARPDGGPNYQVRKFFDLPLGTRFNYPGSKTVWVSLERHGCGKIAKWTGVDQWHAMQSICSVAESEEECRTIEVEMVDIPDEKRASTDAGSASPIHSQPQ